MYHVVMIFSEWIVSELERRGWSRSEAARRGRISASILDKVINQNSKPGLKFFEGIARAFEMDIDDVLSIAYGSKSFSNDSLVQRLLNVINNMPQEYLQDVIDHAEYTKTKARLVKQRGTNATTKTTNRSVSQKPK